MPPEVVEQSWTGFAFPSRTLSLFRPRRRIGRPANPQALDLFRNIMLASAAIPGAFPPTMIDVEVDGKPYQEMHVDGGAMAQVFLYPPRLFDLVRPQGAKVPLRARSVHVIRNARLDPDWAAVERSTLTIVGRAISSLHRVWRWPRTRIPPKV